MIVTEAVGSYLVQLHQRPDDPLLAEMQVHGARERIPIVVPETGALLHVLALARGARRIVEVGTAIGVSTLHLARALPPGGELISFEIDADRQQVARDYLERGGVLDRVSLRLQDAREGLAALEPSFDVAFVDGVKTQYGDYLEQLVPLLAPGSVLIVDNVLMSGAVAGDGGERWGEEQVAYARALNESLIGDARFAATVTPVGDGVLIGVKR